MAVAQTMALIGPQSIMIVPRRVVLLALNVTVMFGAGLLDQDATAGRLMIGSSPIGAMVSSVM
jgi:hypothetical protein